MSIREMKPSDWSEVADIYLQGIQSNLCTFEREIPSYEDWDKAHISELRYVYVLDNKVVGWIVLSPTSARKVYRGVVEMSIYLDNRIKHQGIGSKLLEHLLKEAKNLGYWTFQSSIMSDNIPSLNFHKKHGFREVGYREKIGKDMKDCWRDTIIMEYRNELN